ncbi:crotonase/enoyl-CoA hydratase family protein [Cumulibacter manganitolerans]|uniref:crotonase/enoyl-CoA hydratase family protein n=1 Tax=Cumulibacter manganitolerans TaxID=1884992 RepID=UPI001295C8AD|nr:crotonase/enoyl-CoA hydratase family protein [Cumulibacter manganitolerans]
MRDELPASLRFERRDAIGVLTLARAAKRNALDDETVLALGRLFTDLPSDLGAIVIDAEGDHFCAGLDLGSLAEHSTFEGIQHSRMWHRSMGLIEDSPVPVIAALKGAVVGGGLELATAAHLRVADGTAFYVLPEGQRGIFVGGGASVRVPRLIGFSRMMDMMLTGRKLTAREGQDVGLSHYLVDTGSAARKALDLAAKVARNSPATNFAVTQALPRIAESNPRDGYLMESLMAAIAQGTDEAKARMADFVAGRAAKADSL